ncbi:MAG: tyrosine-type recombinase/integrase [Alphaproteobacteria bacterium]
MRFHVIQPQKPNSAQSPIRVVEHETGREVGWVNRYLDREYVRRVANTTLRACAYSLLHFVRWCESTNHRAEVVESDLSESTLLEYLKFQSKHNPRVASTTINFRIGVAERALRNEFPDAPSAMTQGFQHAYMRRGPLGLGRRRLGVSRLRVRVPKHQPVPLSIDEVARFWSSFRTARDLAVVGLMLMQGLRSAEVVALNGDDVLLSEAQLRVLGKGDKRRLLPLAPETVQLLDHYRHFERPEVESAALFLSLKGRARGTRMTLVGLRSLFRHHRKGTGIKIANPHRFRHTFASDMVRAGISLPALKQLMGHSDIDTTLQYVYITPQDVYLEYTRAVAQIVRPVPRIST